MTLRFEMPCCYQPTNLITKSKDLGFQLEEFQDEYKPIKEPIKFCPFCGDKLN